MEEVQVIDCPPTPEILLASATPPSTSLLDMLDSSSSAEELDNSCSGDAAGDDAGESGRSSPPPKCAICLGKCRQKCYTDSCRHQFCYRCLLEWSKIKAECPLCKQAFRSIIYNRKTYGHYQEHKISIAPPASPPSYAGQGSGSGGGGAARTMPQVYHRLDFTLSQPPRFTYSATLHVQPSQSERLRQLFLHQSGDVQRFSREYPDDSIPSRQNGPEWRRYIYHRRLHARPLADINGRMRECSAAFYRENPAQIHRLMPWINRELVALSRNNPSQVSLIMEDFPNLLMTHDITSPAFRERVSYWGRVRTAHFIHELLNFARSPYDMIGYDRSVQYDPYYNNNVVVLSSSSSSSSGSGLSASEGEDDVVPILEPMPGTSGTMNSVGGPSGSARRGRTQFTIETRSSDQTVIMTGSFGGAGVSGIVSVSTSGSQQNNGSATSTSGYPDMSRMQPLTSMVPQQPPPPVSRLEDGENISLSSSDSDDCRIVGALKPPHLRTPEMVSLESESDSDVVFVNDDTNTARNQAMESNSVLEQLFPETLLNQELAKLEDHAFASEYNNGASTSSGGGSASGGMKKYYAKPRLNRYAEGIGFKSIYEASESEKSHGDPSIKSDSDSSSHDEVKFNIRGQAPAATRKRKALKRRQASSTGSSSSDSSDESSTSDSESSSPSSSGCSSTSSSNSDSDSDCSSDNKVTLKKRSRRSNVRSSRKSSKRRQKESKPKRSKVKKRKTSSSKRSSRKRQKLQIPKTPSKTSSESGKGTSASCTSGPSTETIPSAITPPNATSVINPASSSSGKKRKLKSAIIKLNPVAKAVRQQLLNASKRRRKAPICSELITSTDFSSDENPPAEPSQQQTNPSVQQEQTLQRDSTESSSGDTDTSDSEEGRCTIASLIRAAKADDPPEMKQQNTSTSSCSSSSTSKSSCSANSSHTEPPSQVSVGPEEAPEEDDDDDEEEEDEEDDEGAEEERHDQSPAVSTGDVDVDVSVAQVIAVGAEVEL
ncbi:AAEL008683-PA [Aedes aegypti]|uniref:E3 ubiquitin-protein ligase Topors n=2 Tax=Aedes aegypti TaxID=7159 RepID=Q16Y38_AEDAE|nr:E3 ubiquitin-protein ligase Topors [Aedes aegypti]EAT39521.1 AAEL008683-PA [Aedes aegypti]